MEFAEILAALAEVRGLERLEPDESNMVHLGAKGAALTIIGEPDTRTVVLMSEIDVLPAEGREKFFAEALKADAGARPPRQGRRVRRLRGPGGRTAGRRRW